MTLEKTTVILPTYNRGALLVEAVESVLAQTLPAGEIIVADDGSTDDTAERMAAYGDRIRYVRKPNSGKADTLNQCLPLAVHPLIWVMDDDDLALPTALEILTALISGRPEIGVAFGSYRRFHDEPDGRREEVGPGYWPEFSDATFRYVLLQDFFPHHPGMLVRRSAYEAAGPFSTEYPRLEDYEMLLRLSRVTGAVGTDDVVFHQRQHDGDRVGGLAADFRTQRWIDEERALFSRLYDDRPLAEFLGQPGVPTELDASTTREALVRRGAVMGRKKLWDLALADFEAACRLLPDDPLAEGERTALRNAFFSKYGCPEVLDDPDIGARMANLARLGAAGRAMAITFARAQIWFINANMRAGEFPRALRSAGLAVRLAAAGGRRS